VTSAGSKSQRPSKWRTAARWGMRLGLAMVGVYCGFLALGFVPVNGDYEPPAGDDRVVVFVRTNSIHTDLVLPVDCTPSDGQAVDWRTTFPADHFRSDVSRCQYVAVGWGNRAFYVDTPTWREFRLSTALAALAPSETVLHVEYLEHVVENAHFREVHLSGQQYQQLVGFVRSTIGELAPDGAAVATPDRPYGSRDRFYAATGRYHAFNTCNQWTGRALSRASVPTGVWTPLTVQVFWWLPESEDR